MLTCFWEVDPLAFLDTVIAVIRKRCGWISQKQECHVMMPMLRFTFFLTCWDDMGIDMQQHRMPILIENIRRSHAGFLEHFAKCCISWMFIVWFDMPSGILPVMICRVIDEKCLLTFTVEYESVRDDMPDEILAGREACFWVFQLFYQDWKFISLFWIEREVGVEEVGKYGMWDHNQIIYSALTHIISRIISRNSLGIGILIFRIVSCIILGRSAECSFFLK